jgi:ParB/RepB/Spo0J family partition protein
MKTSALPETSDVPGENPVEQIALLPDEPLKLSSDMMQLWLLDHEIVPEPTKQLLDSIRRFGILQPILVRERPEQEVGKDGTVLYNLVDGRRRLAACRELGINPIPVMIAETDLAIADVATLATNATRTSNPIAEYDAIERLIRKGATIKDISGATGMSQQTIKARQRLFGLEPTLLDAFRAGKVTVSVAEASAKLPKPIQKVLALLFFTEQKLTMTDVHEARQARTQQAMAQMEPFDLAVKDTDESRAIPDPPEFDLANRLAAIADEIDPSQGVIIRSIRWCASILMDIATGQQRDYPLGKFAAGFEFPAEWHMDDPPPVQDQEAQASSVGFFGATMHYAMGQGVPSDETPHEAEIEQPNRVFTVRIIEEPQEEESCDEEPEDMDTSDQEPYPAEQADDERHPGNWMNEVFER